MSLKQILEEPPKLTSEERQEVRDWLDAEEFPETDQFIAAADDGIWSSETEQMLVHRGGNGADSPMCYTVKINRQASRDFTEI